MLDFFVLSHVPAAILNVTISYESPDHKNGFSWLTASNVTG